VLVVAAAQVAKICCGTFTLIKNILEDILVPAVVEVYILSLKMCDALSQNQTSVVTVAGWITVRVSKIDDVLRRTHPKGGFLHKRLVRILCLGTHWVKQARIPIHLVVQNLSNKISVDDIDSHLNKDTRNTFRIWVRTPTGVRAT
jgi:hypothetical protein